MAANIVSGIMGNLLTQGTNSSSVALSPDGKTLMVATKSLGDCICQLFTCCCSQDTVAKAQATWDKIFTVATQVAPVTLASVQNIVTKATSLDLTKAPTVQQVSTIMGIASDVASAVNTVKQAQIYFASQNAPQVSIIGQIVSSASSAVTSLFSSSSGQAVTVTKRNGKPVNFSMEHISTTLDKAKEAGSITGDFTADKKADVMAAVQKTMGASSKSSYTSDEILTIVTTAIKNTGCDIAAPAVSAQIQNDQQVASVFTHSTKDLTWAEFTGIKWYKNQVAPSSSVSTTPATSSSSSSTQV